MNLLQILAQATNPSTPGAPPGGASDGPPPWLQLVPFIFIIALLLFFSMRTKKGEQQKRDDMLSKLKKGDEVHTIGGEYGRVMDIKDDRILIKVDESSNTKIWYSRSSIHRVMGEEKAAAK